MTPGRAWYTVLLAAVFPAVNLATATIPCEELTTVITHGQGAATLYGCAVGPWVLGAHICATISYGLAIASLLRARTNGRHSWFLQLLLAVVGVWIALYWLQ